MKKMYAGIALMLLMATALAADVPTALNNVYNLILSVANVAAIAVLAFGGLKYMTAGNDPMSRDQAKQIMMGAIIGLIIINAAPWIVNSISGGVPASSPTP